MNEQIEFFPRHQTSGKIRVLVVNDHPIMADGIRSAIRSGEGIEIIGVASEQAAETYIERHSPDIVILDADAPDVDVSRIVDAVAGLLPDSKVLLFTFVEEAGYVREMFNLGVTGYLLKRSPPEEIVRAIVAANGGTVYIDPLVAGKLVSFPDAALSPRRAESGALSAREIEVLKLAAWGFTDKETAYRLRISIKSVGTYKHRATLKLGVSTRAGIVHYAVAQRWLTAPQEPRRSA